MKSAVGSDFLGLAKVSVVFVRVALGRTGFSRRTGESLSARDWGGTARGSVFLSVRDRPCIPKHI